MKKSIKKVTLILTTIILILFQSSNVFALTYDASKYDDKKLKDFIKVNSGYIESLINEDDAESLVNVLINNGSTKEQALTTIEANFLDDNIPYKDLIDEKIAGEYTSSEEEIRETLAYIIMKERTEGFITKTKNEKEIINNSTGMTTDPNNKHANEDATEERENKKAVLGDSDASTKHNLDEILKEATGFLKNAKDGTINAEGLQSASDTVYNILLALGIVASVVVGIILALRFMFSSVEEQAKVKEAIIPYIVGCIVIFGAFTIWKLAIIVLRGIA